MEQLWCANLRSILFCSKDTFIYKNAHHYLCYFISGVPFDSEKDLGKDLRDVHAVVSGREREREQLLCVASQHAEYGDSYSPKSILAFLKQFSEWQLK